MLKKILCLVLTLSMVLALGVTLVSCTDDTEKPDDGGDAGNDDNKTPADDGKDTYTVTVKDTDGNAVKNVELAMVKVTDSAEIPMPDTQKTSSEGKTEFNVKAGNWKVAVVDVPNGYVAPGDETYFEFTDKAVTITISMLPKYTIKVVDQNGDAVVGARVQMCINGGAGTCVSFKIPTDDNGESSMRIAEDAFEATVTELPEGYAEYDGGYTAFNGDSEGGFTITLTVTKN